ncbi:MAG: hypothetical protein WBV69_21620 [Candidatus Sulfotelmatobacter sp.]
MKLRILVSFLLLFVPIASAQRYTITDLGPLSPTAINAWGQVVGNLNNGHAFIWTQFTGARDLGTLPGGTSSSAAGINDLGAVTGTADGPGTVVSYDPSLSPSQECSDLTQPFVWTPYNGMKGLGAVEPPVFYLEFTGQLWCQVPFYGTSINIPGEVVGYTSAYPDLYQWSLQWTNSAGMSLFGGTFTPTVVNEISNTGQIVGQNSTDEIGQATSWKNGVATALLNLGAGTDLFYTSSANGVNDRGQVVGWSTTIPFYPDCDLDLVGCPIHAVLWSEKGAILDLGTLPGDTLSSASNISFFGQVIGSSGNTIVEQGFGGPGGSGFDGEGGVIAVVGRPFLWTKLGGMRDLNTLISKEGWVLKSATGINFWGQIVGSGTLHGQTHGFLLTPTFF